MSSILDSMRSVKNPFTSSEEQEPEETDDGDTSTFFTQVKKQLPHLTYKQRVIGFGISAGLAAGFAILGCILSYVNLIVFGILFTLGTIAGIFSTFFLVNPIDQAKKMCDTSNVPGMVIKIGSAITLFVMIVFVFCAAFWWKIGVLAILFCIVEFVALVVYAITLIPFATTVISRGARTAFSSLSS